ncbi:MAG: NAD(P)H:quinone oxidoreductase [Gammaproteobacteria bacterium]|nr:NAD(P)H:quinone oxidoreductase [Gammaproteobacteria bacterium]
MSQPYILILYYSLTGSTAKMAQQLARGVEEVEGLDVRVRTVPRVFTGLDEPPTATLPEQGPPYVTLDDLRDCAGLILGSPSRFGNMATALKYFIDSTGGLWLSGALSGKPAGVFTSTSNMHGGQETTLLSMILPLLHQGMIWVGLPPTEPDLRTTKSGGTPYGPSHVSGPESKHTLTDEEIRLCKHYGKRIAQIALTLALAEQVT